MAFAAYDHQATAASRRPSSRGHLVATPTVDPGFLAAAVITGAPEWLPTAVVALKNEGFDILAAGSEADALGADIPARTVACYVQYPPLAGPSADRPFELATSVLGGEMVARLEAMSRVAPLLAPGAAVVLVAGDHLTGGSAGAALDLSDFLRVFGDAIERDRPDVAVLAIDESLGVETVSAVARQCATPTAHWSSFTGLEPEMAYTDWRDEVLALSS